MKELNQNLLAFLDAGITAFHVVDTLKKTLLAEGYQELREHQSWSLDEGGKYFVVRGDSSLIAFRIPTMDFAGFMIAAGHSDSPTYKLRQDAEVSSPGNCVRLSVEPYGGMIHRSWMDRPLSVAGRVVVREGDVLRTKLVNVDRDLLVIPSVAIHMDRNVNKGTELNPAVDLLPLFGSEPGKFRGLVAEAAGVKEEDVLSTELFLYPRVTAAFVGAEEEFIASPRLDDLQCVFGCLEGFLAADGSGSVPMLCVFNNEEVGSGTRQGADSTFLTDVLERICRSKERYLTAAANSFMVSADNAHAVHPAHPEYADKQEAPVLNGGVVIKYNANQRYTTDAVSAAVFTKLCQDAKVPVQRFSNRADQPGGSTLGNISSAHLSIPAVDIGLPQLAMHSSYEVAGAKDTEYLVQVMTKFFAGSFRHTENGITL